MSNILALIFAAVAMFGFTACQTTPAATKAGSRDARGLLQMAGTWKFSHFGSPTVWATGMPDPAQIMKGQFEQAIISLDQEGRGSIMTGGQANRFEVELVDESDLFVKLRWKGQTDVEPLEYDKAQRTLMLPTKLEVPGSKGILPTYFKRGRR